MARNEQPQSNAMDKRTWLRLVKSATFPRELRFLRGTLLMLAPLMSRDGVLEAWRDEIIAAAGLPARTVDYHLARTVDAGWLLHSAKGGHGRRGRYEASCAQPGAHNSGPDEWQSRSKRSSKSLSCAQSCEQPATHNSPEVVRNVVAKSEQIRASESEHQALNPNRQRRSNRNGTVHDGNSSSDTSAAVGAAFSCADASPARGTPNGSPAAAPTTEIANTRLNNAARDLRLTDKDHNSAEDQTTNGKQPPAVTSSDLATLELDPELGAQLDAKHEARQAQLGYQRTGGIP